MAFWQTKTLTQMTDTEWESLCDRCGQCCLHKLEDFDTGEIFHTNVACRLLDLDCLKCKRYENRRRYVANCMDLRKDLKAALKWLPKTCSYRLLSEGSDLPDWHPLVTGDKTSVLTSGHTVKDFAISERDAGDYEDHLLDEAF